MKTKVFVALINDRHAEPETKVFSTPEAAIEYAKGQALLNAWCQDDVQEEEINGFLYYAGYSNEGDYVRVTEEILHRTGRRHRAVDEN